MVSLLWPLLAFIMDCRLIEFFHRLLSFSLIVYVQLSRCSSNRRTTSDTLAHFAEDNSEPISTALYLQLYPILVSLHVRKIPIASLALETIKVNK